jgi:2-iminobutanoate/2-iminopropanoate deaminase
MDNGVDRAERREASGLLSYTAAASLSFTPSPWVTPRAVAGRGDTVSGMFRALLLTALLAVASLHAEKKTIVPPEFAGAPGAPAPMFSPGILVDGTLYVAGQTGNDLKTGAIPAAFEDEVKLCLDRIGLVLKAAGMSFNDVVAVQVYLTDIDLFARMNSVYAGVFKAPRPARTTVGVTKLAAPTAHIEITVTARK